MSCGGEFPSQVDPFLRHPPNHFSTLLTSNLLQMPQPKFSSSELRLHLASSGLRPFVVRLNWGDNQWRNWGISKGAGNGAGGRGGRSYTTGPNPDCAPAATARMGAGGGTEHTEPGREVTGTLRSPRRAHASTRRRRTRQVSSPHHHRLPPLYNRRVGLRTTGRVGDPDAPAPLSTRPHWALVPSRVLCNPNPAGGSGAELLTRAGQCG
jgi:hypothetical protein